MCRTPLTPLQRSSGLLDPQPIRQLQSTTIRALIVGIAALLVGFGIKVTFTETQITGITQGIFAVITLGSMIWAWYGRVKARRVIATKTTIAAATYVAAAIMGAGIAITGCGCMPRMGDNGQPVVQPPIVQVYAAKQVYTGALAEMTAILNAGLIHDAKTLDRIQQVRTTIETTLAVAKIAAENNASDFPSLIKTINDALAEFIKLKSLPTTRPATQPAAAGQPLHAEAYLWKSCHSSLEPFSLSILSWTPTRLPNQAEPSPMNTRQRLTLPNPRSRSQMMPRSLALASS